MKKNILGLKLVVGFLLALCAVISNAAELKLAPSRAVIKPDLIVFSAIKKAGTTDTVSVTVKNNGSGKSGSAVLSAQNTAGSGGSGEASIPSLGPGQSRILNVKLNKKPHKGNKIKLVADSKKHVAESNERNNVKYYDYP